MPKNRCKIPVIFVALALIWIAGAGLVCAEEVKVGSGAAPAENIFKKIKDPEA